MPGAGASTKVEVRISRAGGGRLNGNFSGSVALDSGQHGRWKMADDKAQNGTPDRARINIDEEYELRDWSAKLGVTRWEVRAAVRKVGPVARDVARVLGSTIRI